MRGRREPPYLKGTPGLDACHGAGAARETAHFWIFMGHHHQQHVK